MNEIKPEDTICIVKHNGKEIGRVAATAKNANDYIAELASVFPSGVTVDYKEDTRPREVRELLRGIFES